MTGRRVIGWMVLVAATLLLPITRAEATFPGSNGKIAFSSNASGNHEIYTVNPDGTGVTNLSNTPAHENYPAWSPEGTRIAFVQSSSDPDVRCGSLWVMNADGTGRTPVGPSFAWEPAWSTGRSEEVRGSCSLNVTTAPW